MGNRTVAVAVSGGVDSLLALVLLRERGQEVLAVHGRFLEQDKAGEGLERICGEQGIPFLEVDLREEFERLVVAPFVEGYLRGGTPNPCAACNPGIKFGVLWDRVRERGAGRLATGHYARLEEDRRRGRVLRRGVDAGKDQSYFLGLVPRERLERAEFPLGAMTKARVREELAGRGLAAPLDRESREICFVPGDDYRNFLEKRGLQLPGPGEVVLADGRVLGRHLGLWRHTVGQRRGLGLGWPEPLYVLDKDAAANRLLVGPRVELEAGGCRVERVNELVPRADWPAEVLIQTRYRQKAAPGTWKAVAAGLELEFSAPRSRPAPGQVAALYDAEGTVLAGGIIAASPAGPPRRTWDSP